MSYDNGKDYEGTVVEVLDTSHAWVLFDNYESDDRVDFSDGNFEVTRFGPEPVPQGRGEKRKTPTSSKPTSSKRPRRSGNVDEEYQPTAGDAEEDEEDEE